MKKNFLFAALTAAFLSVAPFMAAQVTIGGGDPPKAGAILDLNSSSGEKGGLLLSNVSITSLNAIPYDVDTDVFPGITSTNHDTEKGKLAGMIVWNTNDLLAPNGDGLYLWDGSKWNYIGGSDGVDILTSGGILTGVGTFTGKRCFDIATGNNGTDGCGAIADRTQKTVFTDRMLQDGVYAASYSGVQVYTFTPSGTVNNVRFGFVEAVGAGKIVESIVPVENYSGTITSGTKCKVEVYYKSSLQNDLSGLIRDKGLKLKLYAIYNDGNADRAIELNTSLQDCACCGAKVSSTEWMDFMCHNLGANEAADPFTPTAEIHGAIYRWGTGVVTLTQAESQNSAHDSSVPDWTNKGGTVPTTSSNWDMTTANPCPDGWRVPTINEWAAVINTSNNAITKVGASWTGGSNNYATGMKVGDALFLPTTGYRASTSGKLYYRGDCGYYWSSTAKNSSNSYYLFFSKNSQTAENYSFYRSDGFPVRCISK
ncbi:MAG: hypothetical protein LBS16_02665 [Prevotellaceae bacterium]|jgi:uncharacterized protein (TIGR02145 family)|nr:hypothetical protein [Prevotellaceae bacterium]